MQDTKADFKGLANSAKRENLGENGQPLSHFHSVFYDMFTVWLRPAPSCVDLVLMDHSGNTPKPLASSFSPLSPLFLPSIM